MAITFTSGLEPIRYNRKSFDSVKESDKRAAEFLQGTAGVVNPLETQVIFSTGVSALTITNAGSGYLSSPLVTFVNSGSFGGSGATATANLTSGTVTSVTNLTGGAGYTVAPKVILTGNNTLFTFIDDDIAFDTNIITKTAHGMSNGDRIHLTTDNVLPVGLYSTDVYGNIYANPDFYVVSATTDTFQLSTTSGGSAVDTNTRDAIGSAFIATGVPAGYSASNMVVAIQVSGGDNYRGRRYASAPTITISAPPEGGTQATATCTITDGRVDRVTMTTMGLGYISVPTVTFSGGHGTHTARQGGGAVVTAITGSGAIGAVVTNASGVITSISVTAGGSNYLPGTVVSITGGGGTGATATAVVSGGAIGSVSVTNGGTTYASLTSLVGYLTSIQSNLNAEITQANADIAQINSWLHSGGSGYTSVPGVSFGGGGSGAAGTASISGGEVTGVSVTSGGSGYSEPTTVSFSGGGGSGASATAILSSGSVSSVSFVDLPVAWVNAGYTSGDAASVKAAVDGYITKCTEAEAAIASLLAQINVSSAGNFLEHNEMLCGLLPARFTPAPAKKAFESIKAIGSSVMTIKDVCGVEYENYMEKLFGTLLNGDDTINTCRANLNINPLSAGTYALLTITTRMIAASSNAVTLIAEIAAIQVPLAAWILIINGDTGAFNTLRTTDEAELVAAEAFIAYFARGQRDIGYWGEDFDIFLYTDILGSRKSLQILTDRENGTIA